MQQIKERTEQRQTCADKPYRVLFVCTGNTCRSPMAEAVANAYAKEYQRLELRAFSAGLCAYEGDPISKGALVALSEREIKPISGRDYRRHTAHKLVAEEIAAYDLLVGMTDAHVMQLLMYFPEAAERIVRMPTPIPDPFGGGYEEYGACLDAIIAGVRELLFAGEEK